MVESSKRGRETDAYILEKWKWDFRRELEKPYSLDTYVPSFLICSLLVVLVTVLSPLAFLFPLHPQETLQTPQIPAPPTPSNSTQTFSLPNHSLLPVSLHTSLPSSPPTPWITTSSTYPVTPTFDYEVITAGNQTILRGKNIVVDDMDVYSDDPSGTGNGGTGGLGHVLQYKGNWGVLSPETFVLDN
ncbi:hypothetical protein D9758_002700 [Tetrapyrgos nigripes]|uniref:Uncharacterized protein n=1 Tax=Tetrapyrgos nigripes TaxID=182062 RepID=A0A8H5GQR1_9AGAR|nr:hypothetical protein D9758_002700 [Tetrapyrgos nigripes]